MTDQPDVEVLQPTGYPTNPAARNSNTGLILVIIVLLLFFMCCCCVFLIIASLVWGVASFLWYFGDYILTGSSYLSLIF